MSVLCGNGPAGRMRKVIHIDMDAFYASVEQRDDPRLRNVPVIVGGPPGSRSVVCSASYAARATGVRSAMPCSQAARLCPDAVFVTPDFSHYTAASAIIKDILLDYSRLIEPLSLDEAYLDVTDNLIGEPSATRLAMRIRQRIRDETGLIASAGVGPNKFIAKAASDAAKPNGLCVVAPNAAPAFVAALPISALPGVGAVTAARCQRLGLSLVGDILARSDQDLAGVFGSRALWLREVARGIDDRPVVSERTRRSIGIESTFAQDHSDLTRLGAELDELAHGLALRLHHHGVVGHTLTIVIKFHDFKRITRAHSVHEPFADQAVILALAQPLLQGATRGDTPIRLLGLSASRLISPLFRQERLFAPS